MTIDAVEFIRRFLLHALPKKFMRIRHIGFLVNRCKKKNLETCRKLLGGSGLCPQSDKSVQEIMLKLTGKDILLCPRCKKGRFETVGKIPELTGTNPFDMIHPLELRRSG